MIPSNLQIKKDFEAGIIKHKGYHNALVVFAFIAFILLAFGFKYLGVLIDSPYNLGTIWWVWGFAGAFVAKGLKSGSKADILVSFPLIITAIIVAYPIDFLYRTFKGK